MIICQVGYGWRYDNMSNIVESLFSIEPRSLLSMRQSHVVHKISHKLSLTMLYLEFAWIRSSQPYSQVILSLMIPLPMIPLVLLTRNKKVMGEFVNRNITTIISVVFVGIILAFNSYLIATTIKPQVCYLLTITCAECKCALLECVDNEPIK